MSLEDSGDPRDLLADAARLFYERGWMAGTAGNLSLRLEDGSFWITASGKLKGRLRREDFLRIAPGTPGGEVLERGRPEDRPSAETSLHDAIYRLFPEARACFHVHSVPGNVAARLADGGALRLPPLEMIKGFGIWEEEPDVSLAVFPNHAHVPRIAEEMAASFAARPPRVPGFLIRDHGLTTWGRDADAALNHVELFEYLFGFLSAARAAGLKP
ncbi:MAG TPA: methylthioribulose 1-phosphate dehydratase [Thermoanaerobaculia bacterium]|jgi:methylthioribulose-1-phosphate dehydratase|nr:methylthioribulose 1-phosphate dehydratase [Thermoanaerobaculia bacterium]